MALVLLPVLVSATGVRRMVYVDTSTLEVTPFVRELAGATAFNGVGVLARPGRKLPPALRATAIDALVALLNDAGDIGLSDKLTLTFIPFS